MSPCVIWVFEKNKWERDLGGTCINFATNLRHPFKLLLYIVQKMFSSYIPVVGQTAVWY